jgi:elongation factor P hydroxylase
VTASAARLAAAGGFHPARLERLFEQCFAARWRTVLIGGAEEPFYRPAARDLDRHRLYYRSDYFASALHEIAHWCIAGEQRRLQADFGYWYAPEGRDASEQRAFEAVEAKPQALEWLFSQACGYRFSVSVDNLCDEDGRLADTTPFKRQVVAAAQAWLARGVPLRAGLFFAALAAEFGTGLTLAEVNLDPAGLAG